MILKPKVDETLWSRGLKVRDKYIRQKRNTGRRADWSTVDLGLDDEFYSLLQTGALVLRMGNGPGDLTRETRPLDRSMNDGVFTQIVQLETAKVPDVLIRDFSRRLTEIEEFAELTHALTAELPELTDDDSIWKTFIEARQSEISLLFENQYASPQKLYDKVSTLYKKESKTNLQLKRTDSELNKSAKNELRRTFFSAVVPRPDSATGLPGVEIDLKKQLRRKSASFEKALTNSFVCQFRANEAAGWKSPEELSGEILRFRKRYYKEIDAIIKTASGLRKDSWRMSQNADAAASVASMSLDAVVYLGEILWNSAFYCAKPTCVDSVLATLNDHTLTSIKREQDTAQRRPVPSDLPTAEAESSTGWIEPSQSIKIHAYAFMNDHRALLINWLQALQDAAKKEITVRSFIDYAFTISPHQMDSDTEHAFYFKLKALDTETEALTTAKDLEKYQARVRDGRYKAIKLFNTRFFRTSSGLVMIGRKQLDNETLLEVVRDRQGVVTFILFPGNVRPVDSDLPDEIQINCLLESLQAADFLLFDTLKH